MKKIGILPAYNEEKNLPEVINEIKDLADQWILVDDGSTDSTGDLLKNWSLNNPALSLHTKKNHGKAYALRLAFEKIKEEMISGNISPDDVVFTTDADGQIPGESIKAAIHEFGASGIDILICRRDFSIYPKFKVLGNRCLTFNASLLSGFKYNDSECGLRIMRAGIIPDILKYYTGFRYSAEQEISIICPRLGLKVKNDFMIKLRFYRSNTKISDFIINFLTGWAAFLKTINTGKPMNHNA